MTRRYSTYKDSGVEWIGEIPEHWEVKKLKYLADITLGKMLTPENKGNQVLKPYLRSFNIQTEKIDVSDVKEMWFSKDELKNLYLQVGDLLINEGGDVGRSAQWNQELDECYFQNSVNRVRFTNSNGKYFLFISHLHHSTKYYDSIVNRVSIPHLTKEKLQEVRFIHPPPNEQSQIVEFLDAKTALIDRLVDVKQRRIELLKEKRAALINHAVTKGLDPNVKMKDSGIEWIGEIPEHWVVSRFKYETQIPVRYGLNISSDVYEQHGVRFIRITDITEAGEISDLGAVYLKELDIPKDFLLESGDMLFSRSGHTVGKSYLHLKSGKFASAGYLVRFNFGDFVKTRFIHFVTKSQYYWDWIRLNTVTSTIENVNGDKYQNFIFVKPSEREQKEIVNYLEIETKKIDDLVTLEQKKINLLKEYRQALISETVTGKIKVTND